MENKKLTEKTKLPQSESHSQQNGQKFSNKQFFFTIIIITILSTVFILSMQGNNATSLKAPISGENIKIKVSSISEQAKYYYYDKDSVRIKFFVVIGYDNKIHVAFDACDVCYAEKKGYKQMDAIMVCNNCGKQYNIVGIGTDNLTGGCWPSYLPLTISTDAIYIKITDIIDKKYLFV